MTRPIHVLIVDDNPTFLEATVYFLSTEPQVEVVGVALSGREVPERVKILHPDLILLDYAMSCPNGLEVTRWLKALPDPPKVVIMTMHDYPDYRAQAQAVRADGVITKVMLGQDLLPLIAILFSDGVGGENPAPTDCPPETCTPQGDD